MEVMEKLLNETEFNDLAAIMTKKYQYVLAGRSIEISGGKDDEDVSVKVLIRNLDESFYYPVEGRMQAEVEEMSAREAQLFLVDYIDLYLGEFLEGDEDLFIPIDWTSYEYEANNFQLRGQIFNRKVEKLADEFLEMRTQ